MADTWATIATTWAGNTVSNAYDFKLIAAPANYYRLDQLEVGQVDNATDVLVSLERVGLPLGSEGESTTVKLVKGFSPVITGTAGTELLFWFGAQEKTPEDTVEWEGPFSFIIGETDYLDPFVSGRFLALKVSSQSKEPWVFQGYTLDVVEVGDF